MRRFIALVLCIALCFGMAMPSYALDATHIYTACSFWSFLNRSIFSGIYDVADALWGLGSDYYGGGRSTSYNGGGRPDADVQSAYNSYVSDLDSSGSHVLSSDSLPLPVCSTWTFPAYDWGCWDSYATSGALSCSGHGPNMTSGINFVSSGGSSVSRSGNYVVTFSYNSSVPFSYSVWNIVAGSGTFSKTISLSVGSFPNYNFSFTSTTDYINFSVSIPMFVYADGMIPPPVSSRAPSILTTIMQTNTTNNAYYIGTKDASGAVTNVYTTNIFNEETKVFTVPGETPVTYNITNWNYDYSTRTYNCTNGTNNYIVTYGDDHITVTVPDGNGGTTSTDYYYVHQTPVPTPAVPGSDTTFPDSSSDNYEDDPNTTGGFFSIVWKAFKDGLASLIAGIIKGLFKGIKALIDGITFVFSDLVSGFFGFVTSFFNSFGTGPGSVGQFFGGGVVDLG